jgi:hypothetical protein
MLICLYFSWASIKESVPAKSILFSCLFSLVAIPVAWLIRDLSISTLWSFISIVLVTATIYFLFQYFVAKNKILDESVHFIKKKLTRK